MRSEGRHEQNKKSVSRTYALLAGPLEAENVDATSIKLSWKPPVDDGGDKVTNYVVLKREKGKKSWTKAAPYVGADEQDLTVKNLVEGKEYEFQVVAEVGYRRIRCRHRCCCCCCHAVSIMRVTDGDATPPNG